MQKIIRKILLDDITLVASTNNEVVNAEMAVNL
jgi:hypothetical protein